jgi:long-chain fatty acid transport protein
MSTARRRRQSAKRRLHRYKIYWISTKKSDKSRSAMDFALIAADWRSLPAGPGAGRAATVRLQRRLQPTSFCIAAVLALTSGWTPARAGSGFDLRSQSTTLLGSAEAGMMTETGDASLIVNNPASLGWQGGSEVVFGGTPIVTSAHFNDGSASNFFGAPLAGGTGGDNGTKAVLPNFYAAADLAPRLRVGLAVTSLYGLGSKWQPDWIGRYYANSSQLVTFDILTTVSWRPLPSLSLGVAPIIQYARAKSTAAIDFGTIDAALSAGLGAGQPGLDDGGVSSRSAAWTAGVEVGALLEPLPGTRIGAAYRSALRSDLVGTASFQPSGPVGDAVVAATGGFMSGNIRLGLNLPATATVGVSRQFGDRLTIMADLQRMQWHTLQGLTITFQNPAQPPVTTPLDWHDSWFFASGLSYRVNDKLSLRVGWAWDQSPSPADTRTPLIPDANSYWAAVGLEWRISPTTSLEAAYGHIFVDSANVNLSAAVPANQFRGNLSGILAGSSVDYLSLQIAWRL